MVTVDEAEVRFAGYYASLAYELSSEVVGEPWGKARRYPVPAVLLARLAVDRDYQGAGIGRQLLLDALHEDAACFYLKYGFRRFRDQELTLFMTMRDLRATLAATST